MTPVDATALALPEPADALPWERAEPGKPQLLYLAPGTWLTRYPDGALELSTDVPGLARLSLTLLPTAAAALVAHLLAAPTAQGRTS